MEYVLKPDIDAKNNNVRLQGNEIGLLAYYPFESHGIPGITLNCLTR